MNAIDPAVASVLAAKDAAMKSDINMAVAKKGLDAMTLQGQAAVQMIEAAGSIGKAPGKGLTFDAFA